MARSCPLCENQPLQLIHASDVEVDTCPRCRGMWFDRGELEQFPDRPSMRTFLATARQAPSRCRKRGHLVARSLAACATCRSAPVACPACGARLSLVVTSTCAIDVCPHCEGVWLDAGEFELLEGVPGPKAASASNPPSRWEIPQATATAADPWLAPGAQRSLPPSANLRQRLNSRSPLECAHCHAGLLVRDAFALDGEVYCASCRPPGAVSGAKLPQDHSYLVMKGRDPEYRPMPYILRLLLEIFR